MVVTLVVGNMWRGQDVWEELPGEEGELDRLSPAQSRGEQSGPKALAQAEQSNQPQQPQPEAYVMSYEERMESTNDFFEALFNSLDYSLLLIFLGMDRDNHENKNI